jgi:hypothetical protein
MKRIAIAGRYQDRHAIKELLMAAGVQELPGIMLTATWLTLAAEHDGDLSDEQAYEQVMINDREIAAADLLLYFPCWSDDGLPCWSPGRLIDFGMALARGVPILIVGQPEPTIYQRRTLVRDCMPATLAETMRQMLGVGESARRNHHAAQNYTP